MEKLGAPDRIPTGYAPTPVLTAVPVDVGTSMDAGWSNLFVTAVVVSKGMFYFGVIESAMIDGMEGLATMLQSRAPMTLDKPGRQLWYRYHESLIRQTGVAADSIVALGVTKKAG